MTLFKAVYRGVMEKHRFNIVRTLTRDKSRNANVNVSRLRTEGKYEESARSRGQTATAINKRCVRNLDDKYDLNH